MPEATPHQTERPRGTQMPFVGVTCLGKFLCPSYAEPYGQGDPCMSLETDAILEISALQWLRWKIEGEEGLSVESIWIAVAEVNTFSMIWVYCSVGKDMDAWKSFCLSVLVWFRMSYTCNLSFLLCCDLHGYSTSFTLCITSCRTSWA